jgi:hypothetical protein
MMRHWPLSVLLALGVSAVAMAQDPAPAPAPRREVLRDRIEQTFLARAREEMSLTDEQATKLLAVTRRTSERRRTLESENRRLNQALAREMRPGVAADPRALRRTLDSVVDLRVAVAQVYRDEQRELSSFLSDVQRAQYHVLRERFLARVEDVRVQRAPAARRRP